MERVEREINEDITPVSPGSFDKKDSDAFHVESVQK